jgi:hypothetical protein
MVVCLGIILMKTTGGLGANSRLHKYVGWSSVFIATFSGLHFVSPDSSFSFISPLTVQLITVGFYMVLTWSLTGDDDCLWQGQLTLILASGGATTAQIASSIGEFNTFMLVVLFLNLGLWSLIRGKRDDHKWTILAGTALAGKGLYEASIFTMLESLLSSMWTTICHGGRYLGECLTWALRIARDIWNGTGSALGRHQTLITLGGAFVLLMGGYYISSHKNSLLLELSSDETDAE